VTILSTSIPAVVGRLTQKQSTTITDSPFQFSSSIKQQVKIFFKNIESFIKVQMLKVFPYFLCLDAKKVTKKNQGQPETLRAFVRPKPHIPPPK